MDLKITKTLVIPSNEIKWRFSRSSGPGGQNVNKIENEYRVVMKICSFLNKNSIIFKMLKFYEYKNILIYKF